MSARVLFLDDSGKPALGDSSGAVVIGGFSIPAASAPALNRKFAGAEARFFASRGDPAKWEVKATETIRPNPWKRRKNRYLVDETPRILLGALGSRLAAVRTLPNNTNATTHSGRRYTNEIVLF